MPTLWLLHIRVPDFFRKYNFPKCYIDGVPAGWFALQSRPGRGPAPTLEELAERASVAGFENLAAEYKKLKARDPDFIPSENALHYWGHVVLDADRNAQAMEIFKLDTVLHATQPWPYNSLEEAYEKVKNVPLAMQSYRIALEKQPGNSVAESGLKRLQAK